MLLRLYVLLLPFIPSPSKYHMYSEFSEFLACNLITLQVLKILVGYS